MTTEIIKFEPSASSYENQEAISYFAGEIESAEKVLLARAAETPFFLTAEIARLDALRLAALAFIDKFKELDDGEDTFNNEIYDPEGDHDLYLTYLDEAAAALAVEIPESILGDAEAALSKLKYAETLNNACASLEDWAGAVDEDQRMQKLDEDDWRAEAEEERKAAEGNVVQFAPVDPE